MNVNRDRQESVSTPRWTEQKRARLAQMAARHRRASGVKQSDLADRADVALRTIGNIERGATIPQSDVLKRILVALGLFDEAGGEFDVETRTWLTQMGRLVEMIPSGPRATVMVETTAHIGEEVARYGRARLAGDLSDVDVSIVSSDAEDYVLAADDNNDRQAAAEAGEEYP